MNRYILIRRLRGPAFLLLVGVIALLAQANILSWGQSWPLFLILAGLLLLAERAALRREGYPPYPGGPWPGTQERAGRGPGRAASAAARRSCRRNRMISGTRFMEGSHEQRTSANASGRWSASALRSENAVARVSRTAAGRVARATRCMAGTAPRMEGELRGRIRTARAFGGGSGDSDLRGRGCSADGDRAYRCRRLLVVVRAVVAAAADCGGAGAAGRVGAGHAAGDPRAAQRKLCGDSVSGCVPRPLRGGMEPHAAVDAQLERRSTTSSISSACPSTTATSRC